MTTAMVSKLEELIQPNKRNKVTNAQMIPALVKAIEAGSKEQLDILKEGYPEVFEASSTKYLNKKHSTAFIKIMNGLPLDEETPSEPTENQAEDQNQDEEVTPNNPTAKTNDEPSNVENPTNEENEENDQAEVTAENNEEKVVTESQELQAGTHSETEAV